MPRGLTPGPHFPSPLAVERFLDVREDGVHILGAPKGSVVDPYYISARLFVALVELAGQHVDMSELEPGLVEIKKKLEEMAAEVAQGDSGQVASETDGGV